MDTGRLVLVTCAAPREKFWGVLLDLMPVGATLRAVPLEAFDDFLRQVRDGQSTGIAPVTVFLPAHRLERVEIDESAGGLEGLGDRFARLTGQDPLACLAGQPAPEPGTPRM